MARRRKLWDRRHSAANNVVSIAIAFVIMVVGEILLLPFRAVHWALKKVWPAAPRWASYIVGGGLLLLLAIVVVALAPDSSFAPPAKPAKAVPASKEKPAPASSPR